MAAPSGLDFCLQVAIMERELLACGRRSMMGPSLDQCRDFLKDTIRQRLDFSQTAQHQGVPPPPLEKPFPLDAERLDLPPVGQWEGIEPVALTAAIGEGQVLDQFSVYGTPEVTPEGYHLWWFHLTAQGGTGPRRPRPQAQTGRARVVPAAAETSLAGDPATAKRTRSRKPKRSLVHETCRPRVPDGQRHGLAHDGYW